MGRPLKMGDAIVRKLEQSFEDGLSVSEATVNSGISRDTYYRYLNSDKSFSDRMNRAQMSLTSRAKSVVAKAVKKGNLGASKWLLDRELKNATSKDHQSDHQEIYDDERILEISEGLGSLLLSEMNSLVIGVEKEKGLQFMSANDYKIYGLSNREEKIEMAKKYYRDLTYNSKTIQELSKDFLSML